MSSTGGSGSKISTHFLLYDFLLSYTITKPNQNRHWSSSLTSGSTICSEAELQVIHVRLWTGRKIEWERGTSLTLRTKLSPPWCSLRSVFIMDAITHHLPLWSAKALTPWESARGHVGHARASAFDTWLTIRINHKLLYCIWMHMNFPSHGTMMWLFITDWLPY